MTPASFTRSSRETTSVSNATTGRRSWRYTVYIYTIYCMYVKSASPPPPGEPPFTPLTHQDKRLDVKTELSSALADMLYWRPNGPRVMAPVVFRKSSLVHTSKLGLGRIERRKEERDVGATQEEEKKKRSERLKEERLTADLEFIFTRNCSLTRFLTDKQPILEP